jgi:GNAT superfamily N-acetyltransferase
MITITQADLLNPQHADAVVTLLNHYAMDEMGGGEPLSEFTQNNLVQALHQRPAATVFLAFDDAIAVGLMIVIEGFSTFACQPLLNVHDVVVVSTHRGRGAAKQLFVAAENLARRLGCCKITLEVLEGNRPAQAAYRSYGFTPYALDPKMGNAMFWQKKLA